MLLLLTAVGCNRTRYSYFDKKQACSRFLTDKTLYDRMFGQDKNPVDIGESRISLNPPPVVFYSTSLDTCVAVTKQSIEGDVTKQGKTTHEIGGMGHVFDLFTGMILDETAFQDKNTFERYERDMMKRYEAAE